MFHIALLEFYREKKHDKRSEDSLSNLMNDQQKYEVEEILDKIEKNEEILYLIKWIEYSDEKNQWISRKNLNEAKKLRQKFDDKNNSKNKKRKISHLN